MKDQEHINDIIDNKSTVAYEALIAKYQNLVFTLCIKIIKRREEAQEITQDVFITGFNRINSLEDKTKFKNWIMKIAYSKSIDYVRKKQLETTDINELKLQIFDQNKNPLEDTIDKNRSEIIAKAIQYLKPVEASIITLYYIQGQGIKDISDITGLSTSNVKVKLFRARTELKTIITSLLKGDLTDFL